MQQRPMPPQSTSPSTTHSTLVGDADIVVIGAGVAGLSCSINLLRTAQRLGQSVSVTVFERRDGPGGTWSNAAVYPGLITNNSWKSMLIEDQDNEMAKKFQSDPLYQAGPGGFRATGPAMTVHMEQVESQAKALGTVFHYNTDVLSIAQRPKGGWSIVYQHGGSTETRTFDCDKLVCAAGSFSTASMPPFCHSVWQEELPASLSEPLVVHTQQLSRPQVEAVAETAAEVVVVGASKSAMDAAERYALLGRKVTLVVKNAPYMAPPSFVDKKGQPEDAAAGVGSRLMTSFIPYYADPVSGMISSGGALSSFIRWFMHSTWLGGFAQRALDKMVTGIFADFNQWEASPANALMKPETSMTWLEGSTYPGPAMLPTLIRQGKVEVLRGAAVDLRKSETSSRHYDLAVKMNDGSERVVPGNFLIFGTGWRTGEHKFFTTELSNDLGQPRKYTNPEDRPAREDFFEDLDKTCLEELLAKTRTLRDLPKEWLSSSYGARTAGVSPALQIAPFRLYRLMIPMSHLEARDIAFPGIATNKSNTVLADVQGHWIADYFLDNLPKPLPSQAVAAKDISMHTVWARRLFGPAQGQLGNWLGTQWLEYCGRLCWDMGIPADSEGFTGVIYSHTLEVEKKRLARDLKK